MSVTFSPHKVKCVRWEIYRDLGTITKKPTFYLEIGLIVQIGMDVKIGAIFLLLSQSYTLPLTDPARLIVPWSWIINKQQILILHRLISIPSFVSVQFQVQVKSVTLLFVPSHFSYGPFVHPYLASNRRIIFSSLCTIFTSALRVRQTILTFDIRDDV